MVFRIVLKNQKKAFFLGFSTEKTYFCIINKKYNKRWNDVLTTRLFIKNLFLRIDKYRTN